MIELNCKIGRKKEKPAEKIPLFFSETMKSNINDNNKKLKEAKEILNKSANGKPIAYNNPYLIAYRLASYIEQCRDNETPLTETGLAVALGIDNETLHNIANGEREYCKAMKARETEKDIALQIEKYKQIEHIQSTYNYLINNYNNISVDTNDKNALMLSEPIKKARQLVTLEREERLAKSGKVGDIFTMKAREGWQDTTERHEHIIQIENNNALTALQQLGYRKEE